MSYYLFLSCLLISPLPVCWLLYRHFKGNANKVSGSVFGIIQFKLAGIIIVYVALLLLNIALLCPHLIHLSFIKCKSIWHYQLQTDIVYASLDTNSIPYVNKRHPLLSKQGRLSLNQGPGDILHINLGEKQHQHINGLADHERIIIPIQEKFILPSTTLQRTLVAHGQFNQTHMRLTIYSLEIGKEKNQYISGTLELTRIWPYWQLGVMTLLPLLLLWLLNLMGPINSEVKSKQLKISKLFSLKQFVINFQFKHLFVSYLIIYFAVFLITTDSLPRLTHNTDNHAYQSCKNIEGQWYKNLYHLYSQKPFYRLDYTGHLHVACNKNMRHMEIEATSNPIDVPYQTNNSCYQSHHTDAKEWHIHLVGISSDKLVGMYTIGNVTPQKGIITAIIHRHTNKPVLHFYDFRNYLDLPLLSRSGQLHIFKPGDPEQHDCTQLDN